MPCLLFLVKHDQEPQKHIGIFSDSGQKDNQISTDKNTIAYHECQRVISELG